MSDPAEGGNAQYLGGESDVMHDNFVPEYSSLATAPSKLIVVIGIWLIFSPTVLFGIPFVLVMAQDYLEKPFLLVLFICSVLFAFGLCGAVLFKVTRRYLNRPRDAEA